MILSDIRKGVAAPPYPLMYTIDGLSSSRRPKMAVVHYLILLLSAENAKRKNTSIANDMTRHLSGIADPVLSTVSTADKYRIPFFWLAGLVLTSVSRSRPATREHHGGDGEQHKYASRRYYEAISPHLAVSTQLLQGQDGHPPVMDRHTNASSPAGYMTTRLLPWFAIARAVERPATSGADHEVPRVRLRCLHRLLCRPGKFSPPRVTNFCRFVVSDTSHNSTQLFHDCSSVRLYSMPSIVSTHVQASVSYVSRGAERVSPAAQLRASLPFSRLRVRSRPALHTCSSPPGFKFDTSLLPVGRHPVTAWVLRHPSFIQGPGVDQPLKRRPTALTVLPEVEPLLVTYFLQKWSKLLGKPNDEALNPLSAGTADECSAAKTSDWLLAFSSGFLMTNNLSAVSSNRNVALGRNHKTPTSTARHDHFQCDCSNLQPDSLLTRHEPMSVKRSENGAAPECKDGGNWRSPRKHRRTAASSGTNLYELNEDGTIRHDEVQKMLEEVEEECPKKITKTLYEKCKDADKGEGGCEGTHKMAMCFYVEFKTVLFPLTTISASHDLWGRGGVMVRPPASHLGEPDSIPGGAAPRIFACVGIAPHDAAGRRVFSGISRIPRPCIPALLHIHLASLALKTSLLRRLLNKMLFEKSVFARKSVCQSINDLGKSHKINVGPKSLEILPHLLLIFSSVEEIILCCDWFTLSTSLHAPTLSPTYTHASHPYLSCVVITSGIN
ncbi:hypothetical protein PR048_000388 [Dryococelus australis]|uniref:Uncharacterized protein n=1 Tax=Dryococelus australis TaxID=614101 RepID=A0ABQ9IEG0_9NEOP|nr:hypothetical protein PR048_000388 [Dryococelus australis]